MTTLNIEFGIPTYYDYSSKADIAILVARDLFEGSIHEIEGDYRNVSVKFESNNFSFIKLQVLIYVFAIKDIFDKVVFGKIVDGIIKANKCAFENVMVLVDDTNNSGLLLTLNINEKHISTLKNKNCVSDIRCKFDIAEYHSGSYSYSERTGFEFEDSYVRYRGTLNKSFDMNISAASSCKHDEILSVIANIMKLDIIVEVTKLSIVESIISNYLTLDYELSDDGDVMIIDSCCKSSISIIRYKINAKTTKEEEE